MSPQQIKEKRNRIHISVCACAYEVYSHSFISDDLYDLRSKEIDATLNTGDKVLDKFFRGEFNPCTGMWVYSHPHLSDLRALTLYLIRLEQDRNADDKGPNS